MENRLPPLQWLRSFEAAARHMSFTTAAEELGITQSAVSQQVKALEQFLDQPLFLRRARSLRLTEGARQYLPTVREAFALLTQGTATFLGHDPEGVVEVKANTAFSVLWLAPRLESFLRDHPGIRVNLSTAMWDADFTGGYGSVEIRFGRGEWGGDAGQILSGVKLFPVASAETARRISRIRDLESETLLHINSPGYDWDRWLKAVGHPDLKGKENHAFNTYVMTFALARQGLGVAMAHEVLARDLLACGDLVRVLEQEVPARESYYLVGPRHGGMNRAAEAFCRWLRVQFELDTA
jgi:LysR family glycine cleavage system transcriptional activator